MKPPRDVANDGRGFEAQNAGAICDRLDIVALALADIAGRLGRLNANVEAVLVAVAGGALAERQADGAAVQEVIRYARQIRDIAAALGPGLPPVAESIDFGFGKSGGRT